ncbi:hypothetical protein TcG_11296 [Trypanosoma cruzi]|nr:hypothetical protein TcG_11296 [Trypanosoma cruzi]
MPQGITGLGSRGHQAALHGPPAEWRNHGGEHDCGPPVCGQLQLGAGCSCNTLGLLHSVRPDKCGNFTAAARTVPQCISNHVVTAARDDSQTPRCKHSSQLHAGQGQHVSVVAACLSRDAILRPRSVGWQMVIRVHVNKWTSSGTHAVRVAQSHRERDAAAANPRCLCRIVGQLRVHADWGGGEVLSCRRGR